MADKFSSKGAAQSPNVAQDAIPRSFMRSDFPFIRRATVILLGCVTIGAAMVSGSAFLLRQDIAAKEAVQSLENQTREKLNQAENEQREIHEFRPKYEQLAGNGFVGEERRLDWMEDIRRIQERRNLPALNYEISAQQVFPADPALDTGTLELRGSKMLLKMNLLHEMDLLNFLDDLKMAHSYSLNNCNIKRTSVNLASSGVPRLYAECMLFWITLGTKPGAGGDEATGTPAEQGK